MTSSSAIDSFSEIATVRIELKETDPLIWRVVEVPTSITLKVLHDIVQVTMGWFDYHLWEFKIEGQTYGLPMDDDWEIAPRKVASRVRLRDVLSAGTTLIDYTYDFGDNWEHRSIVSDVRPGEPGGRTVIDIEGPRSTVRTLTFLRSVRINIARACRVSEKAGCALIGVPLCASQNRSLSKLLFNL